ncbi:hypothetical protein L916_16845, partial [Phytophthora nicotianae]
PELPDGQLMKRDIEHRIDMKDPSTAVWYLLQKRKAEIDKWVREMDAKDQPSRSTDVLYAETCWMAYFLRLSVPQQQQCTDDTQGRRLRLREASEAAKIPSFFLPQLCTRHSIVSLGLPARQRWSRHGSERLSQNCGSRLSSVELDDLMTCVVYAHQSTGTQSAWSVSWLALEGASGCAAMNTRCSKDSGPGEGSARRQR